MSPDLSALTTAQLEAEQIRRAIARTDQAIARALASIAAMRAKQIRRLCELAGIKIPKNGETQPVP